jgi:hypothetical protein
LILPVYVKNIDDLLEDIAFNNVWLLNAEFYQQIKLSFNSIPIYEKVILQIDCKDQTTTDEKNHFANAYKNGFITSTIRHLETKKQLQHRCWWILLCFFLSLLFVAGLEFLNIYLDEIGYISTNKFVKSGIFIFKEIMFIILWVMGWTYFEKFFFEQNEIDESIAQCYHIYKSKIVFIKEKKTIQPKIDDEKIINATVKQRDLKIIEKVFLSEEKKDIVELEKINKIEQKDEKKEVENRNNFVIETKDNSNQQPQNVLQEIKKS